MSRENLEYPLPPGFYVLYDVKERRGWWAGGGDYSILPGKAKLYTHTEVNAMLERGAGPHIDIFRANNLGLSCMDFVHAHIVKQSGA
jgi:hypothetical protein